ncbi:MAG: crotonase/enoyl-CoA hydratase family protein [Deltaproteobacteria bacterium]|nr:crotonase/enoyl-CoA hydratase family protein [Deltaproteobacteria bacterium]
MAFEQILCEVDDRVATITLNRPDRLNAWTVTMMEEMIKAFDMLDKDDAVRAIIVTGAGRAFCAGADLDPGGFAERQKELGADKPPRDTAGQFTLKVYETKKAVIAAINGPAVGVGTTMTLPMDIRIASETARMGLVFNRRGMVPEGCCTWFLPRILGLSQAAEWILTGRVFSAREALQGGLVSRVVPEEKLLPTALELAHEIADNTSAVSAALSRQMLWQMLGADHPMEAHKLESKCLHYMFQSPDLLEGVTSFLEKRPPKFGMKPSTDMPDFFPWWSDRPYEDDERSE